MWGCVLRRCSTCGIEKPLETGFYRSKSGPEGRERRCKQCQNAAAYRYRAKHREAYTAYQSAYFTRYYRENRTRLRAKQAAYRLVNLDRIRAVNRTYVRNNAERIKDRKAVWYAANRPRLLGARKVIYRANRERYAVRQRLWLLTPAGMASARRAKRAYERRHPEHNAIRNARRYARIKGAPVVERIDPLTVAERDGWTCHICRVAIIPGLPKHHPESLTLDHLVPLVHGGAHSYANVAAAHRRCNSRRGPGRIAAQLRLLG